jgi:radical SAM protein with 4Fe4S-binding SPASM domain
MVTNATRFRADVARALASSPGGWVDLTLRAFDDESLQRLTRRRGTVARTRRVAERYAAAEVSVGFEIDVLPENHEGMPGHLAAFLDDLSFVPSSIRLHRIAPTGDASHRSDPRISSADWNRLLAGLRPVSDGRGVPIFVEDGLPLCVIDVPNWPMLAPCECGRDFITMGTDGQMRDCPCRPVALGDEGTPIQIQRGPVVPGPPGPAATVHPECAACVLEPLCRGGCRASTGFDGSIDQFEAEIRGVSSLTDRQHRVLAVKPSGVFAQAPIS